MARDDASRAIGKIVSVSADSLVVELHRGSDNFTVVGFDDVHYVATLGSYLMVPTQSEYVVVEVIGLREKDFSPAYGNGAEMDKATAAKFLDVVPVGSMPVQGGSFRFGVSTFPPLYADALYARDEDLDRIFNVDQPPDNETKTNIEDTIQDAVDAVMDKLNDKWEMAQINQSNIESITVSTVGDERGTELIAVIVWKARTLIEWDQ